MALRKHDELRGLRVLVVEDEALIAFLLEDLLAELGCRVVGPAARLGAALALARDEDLDCAILDVNIGGEPVHPVAEILAERGIPFIFATGYGEARGESRFGRRPVLAKPFKPEEICDALTRLLAQG